MVLLDKRYLDSYNLSEAELLGEAKADAPVPWGAGRGVQLSRRIAMETATSRNTTSPVFS